MKKFTSMLLAFGLALPATLFLAGCEQSATEQIEDQQEDVQEQQQEVQDEQTDVGEEQKELQQEKDELEKAKQDAAQPNGTQPGGPEVTPPTTPPGEPQ